MTETMGLIAGLFLLFALVLYTFWPENGFASQKEKTRLDYLAGTQGAALREPARFELRIQGGQIP